MKRFKIVAYFFMFSFLFADCANNQNDVNNYVEVSNNESEKKIDVKIDGKLFTSLLYTDELNVLKKPVLYPIVSSNDIIITRGFPIDPRPNERIDHPHHIGAWLNYGDVNGLDFWNNSDAIPDERASEMGTIRLKEITNIESGTGKGMLTILSNWMNSEGKVIIIEKTDFIFIASEGKRVIDRKTTLTATDEPVLFKDNKEGMIGIRMARQLELPSDKPVKLSDAHGNKTDVPVLDNTGVTGDYLNSEGITGMDNPDNVGYPTYWHARGYGLFAANPLGQKIFSEGEEELNFALDTGESTTFKYRILILDSIAGAGQIDAEYNNFKNN